MKKMSLWKIVDKFIPKVKQRSFNKVSSLQMNSINCLDKTFIDNIV